MPPDRAERVAEIVEQALEREPAERGAFVDESCSDDTDLRREVNELLARADGARDFIETPAFRIDAEALAKNDGELRAGQLVGDYKIISLLGEGGMGEVYLAQDTRLGRDVALKFVRAGVASRSMLRHFREEERILAALNHPNIARLYGSGMTPGGVPFFIMEHIDGVRIDAFCEQRALPIRERLELFGKVCGAVQYAHQRLVIHRDLKPSNILVTAEGEPKLLDFGIGKVLDQTSAAAEFTMTLGSMMTPEYASPEQVRGEAMTTASDVYSLGIILYELLTEQRAYRIASRRPDEIARAITEQQLQKPSTAVAKSQTERKNQRFLRGDLDNIVLMATRKEPARRYTSVGQFAADIRRYLEGLPVIARKDTFAYRSSKFVRRHRVGVGAAAALALALVAGIIAVSWQAHVAKAERDRARLAQMEAEHLNGFLQNLLASADPDGMGRDVKVVQVLDKAATRIDAELATQPEILAQAHLTMARAYARLRQAAATEEHARKALAIEQQIHGDNDPRTAQVMAFLGYALRVFRRFDEAEPLLRQALTVQRAHPPADKKEFAGVLVDLGVTLAEKKRASEAAPLINEAVELNRQTYGAESAEYADALNMLGNLRIGSGDREGAKQAYRQSIDIHRKLVPGRFSIVNPLENLVGILLQEGNVAEAETFLREAEARCRETVGEANPTYANIRGIFGYISFLRNDYHSAATDLRRVVEALGEVYPKSDPNVVVAEVFLGLALTRDGKAAEGEPYLRAAFENGKAGAVSESFGVVDDFAGPLGECLLAQKRFPEAEPLLAQSYASLKASHGPSDSRAQIAQKRLIALYDSSGRTDEAEKLRHEVAR